MLIQNDMGKREPAYLNYGNIPESVRLTTGVNGQAVIQLDLHEGNVEIENGKKDPLLGNFLESWGGNAAP